MKKKYILIVLASLLVLISVITSVYFLNKRLLSSINSFDDCVKNGFAVMELYPRQCRAGFKNFVEEVKIDKTNNGNKNNGVSPTCKIAGCSGQLCVSADSSDIITTCEYKAEYACYKSARCENQSNGLCGWTQTKELANCIENSKQEPISPK